MSKLSLPNLRLYGKSHRKETAVEQKNPEVDHELNQVHTQMYYSLNVGGNRVLENGQCFCLLPLHGGGGGSCLLDRQIRRQDLEAASWI